MADLKKVDRIRQFNGRRQNKQGPFDEGNEMKRQIAGYIVSGPDGRYDFETADLAEAFAYYDDAIDFGETEGWVIGIEYDDGEVSFDRQIRRPQAARIAA
jgi:hypothetical protein